jgi:acyl dehydratase
MRTLAFISIKEWKFLEPVFIGDTIRVQAKLLEKEERSRGRRGVLTWQRQILNQHSRPVEEGQIVTLVEGRGNKSQESGVRSQESGTRGQNQE